MDDIERVQSYWASVELLGEVQVVLRLSEPSDSPCFLPSFFTPNVPLIDLKHGTVVESDVVSDAVFDADCDDCDTVELELDAVDQPKEFNKHKMVDDVDANYLKMIQELTKETTVTTQDPLEELQVINVSPEPFEEITTHTNLVEESLPNVDATKKRGRPLKVSNGHLNLKKMKFDLQPVTRTMTVEKKPLEDCEYKAVLDPDFYKPLIEQKKLLNLSTSVRCLCYRGQTYVHSVDLVALFNIHRNNASREWNRKKHLFAKYNVWLKDDVSSYGMLFIGVDAFVTWYINRRESFHKTYQHVYEDLMVLFNTL